MELEFVVLEYLLNWCFLIKFIFYISQFVIRLLRSKLGIFLLPFNNSISINRISLLIKCSFFVIYRIHRWKCTWWKRKIQSIYIWWTNESSWIGSHGDTRLLHTHVHCTMSATAKMRKEWNNVREKCIHRNVFAKEQQQSSPH